MKPINWDHKPFRQYAILALALATLVLLVHEIFGPHGYLALRRQKQQYSALQKQIQSLSQENQQLNQKIQSLKTNPDAIEKQAREQLHLVRPGEYVYMLPNKKQPQDPSTAQNKPPKQ
ncbi:MAG TPA: septum formation initiator family protein [Terriglobia bacterium]|nr:septum formation initiator family protein [Terriglobia bacterium]